MLNDKTICRKNFFPPESLHEKNFIHIFSSRKRNNFYFKKFNVKLESGGGKKV